MPTFLLTLDPGLEPICAAEYGGPTEVPAEGRVLVEAPDAAPLLQLRTIQHVIELRGRGAAASLDEARAVARRTDFAELADAKTFRVRSTTGDRRELERAVGGVLQLRHGTPVSLEQPAVTVRADVHAGELFLGIQQTGESLARRVRRGPGLRSSLQPTIAAAMIHLVGAHHGAGRLIDPMCGAGVIPVEAATINPGLTVEAADWDAETVEIARRTLSNHDLGLPLAVADARQLGARRPGTYDYVVTEPPFGIRQARRSGTTELYRSLLSSFESALKPGGRLAIAVVKWRAFRAALDARSGLRLLDERAIRTSSLALRVYVIESVCRDAVSGRRTEVGSG